MWRLSNDAEDWFAYLETETKFEKFYFCLLTGLLHRKLGSPPGGDGFLDYFPDGFRETRFEIIGLLLEAELLRLQVDYSSESDVQSKISRLIDHEAQSRLSTEGFEIANRYASEGFIILKGSLGDAPPRDKEAFLIRFNSAIAQEERETQVS